MYIYIKIIIIKQKKIIVKQKKNKNYEPWFLRMRFT